MANFKLQIKLRDAFKRTTRRSFDVQATDEPTAMTNAAAFISDYASYTEAEVLEYSIKDSVVYTDTVDAGANKDEGITFSLETVSGKTAPVKIPAPIKNDLDANGNVDLAGTATSALMSHFLSGFVLVSDGETVAQVLKGTLDA